MAGTLVNRTYTPRTTRLLSEYLALTYSHATVIQEFHISKPNPAAIAAAGGKVSPLFGSTILGFPDAAVILPTEIQFWESKDQTSYVAIGQLEGYAAMYATSYEITQYLNHVLTLHILAAHDDPVAHASAASKGIEVAVYNPAWYDASVTAAERNSSIRNIAALSQPIVELVVEGHLTEANAITKLISLGMDEDSARQRIENAISSASTTES